MLALCLLNTRDPSLLPARPAGVLVLCLFNISNPFLHAAKVCNQLGMPARMPAFALFAAVFFLTRVLLVPYSILRVTLVDSW